MPETIFCYKIVELAYDKSGNAAEVYSSIIYSKTRKLTAIEYDKMHQHLRPSIAKLLNCDINLVEPISQQEYQGNGD